MSAAPWTSQPDQGSHVETTEDRARRAYQAYGETTHFRNYQGLPMPAWEDLGTPIQHAWMAAADALTGQTKETTVQLTLGRSVHYTLNTSDAEMINRRRTDFAETVKTNGRPPTTGHQAHVGNYAEAGQVFPATVVRIFDANETGTANLQVVLDGNDTYWATSRKLGDGEGCWAWPPRV